MASSAAIFWFSRSTAHKLAGIAAYLAAYIALDWISLIDPFGPVGITPWNPPAGLTFTLLLRYGLPFMPVAFGAIALADVLFHGLSASPEGTIASALAISLGYGGAAAVLRRRFGISTRLDDHRDLLALLMVALGATVAVSLCAVGIFCLAGLIARPDFSEAALRFWVGDVIGIAVLTPFLLLRLSVEPRPTALRRIGDAEYRLQVGAIAFGLWVIFGYEESDHFELSYLLLLPLIWIALRDGLRGATWGIVATQLGLILAIQLKGYGADVVTQFQLLMLAVAATGLFLGAAVDERRRAEASLRDSEAQLQTIVDTAPDAILTFEASGALLSANRAAERMFGLESGKARGIEIDLLLPAMAEATRLPGDAGGAHLASARLATIPLASIQGETTARRRDGTPFVADVSVGEARASQRTVFVAVARDATARKQAEALLKQHETELAHAARVTTTGEMAAALAHELNQPLTAMTSFARACQELLRAPARDIERHLPQALDLIEQAVQQALRAGQIIRGTREFLQRGDSRHIKVEVNAIFRAALDLVRGEAAVNGVAILVQCEDRLPALFADPIQIEQVVLNLIRNSIDALTRTGTAAPRVTLTATRSSGDPDSIDISVADNGPGFPPEIVERLFAPFVTTKDTGMGLGMSISRNIVEAHGGRISAANAMPSPGAIVRFTLPAYGEEGDLG